jgi:hypothetical protein
MELGSAKQARREAVGLMGELLINGSGDALLGGVSLRLWVTNGPSRLLKKLFCGAVGM